MAAGLPSWDSCVFNSIDQCGQAYLGGAIALGLLVTGLWIFRDLVLDALSDIWPRIQARLPRRWLAPGSPMPAVLVASEIHSPAQAGRLWFGATLSGSDPPATDPEAARQGLRAIATHDPTFREDALIDHARRAVPVVLRAWTEQDSRISHRAMAPIIWEQQKEDLAAYRGDGRRNVLEGLRVSSLAIVGAASDARFDSVVVRLNLAAADYDVAVATGAVVRGSRTASGWAEDWVFQRPRSGRHLSSSAAGCSRCGAPLDLDVAGVCNRCDGEIQGPAAEWLLTRIDVVSDTPQTQVA